MVSFWQYPFFILHDVAALLCMTVVLSAVRGFRERSRPVTVGVFAVAIVTATVNILLLNPLASFVDAETGLFVYGAASLLPVLLFPQIVLRSSRRLTSALICLALNVGLEGLFSVLGSLFEGVDDGTYLFYETVFCGLGYGLIAALMVRFSKNRDLNVVQSTVALIPRWLYIIIIVCSFYSYFSVMGRAPGLYNFERFSDILRVFSVLGVILFAGYFVLKVFALTAKQNRILMEMNSQQQSYERMLKSDEQLRHFRHDYKNHMLVVTSLLNAGLTDEAKDYLEKIKGDSGVNARRFSTGNTVADALLNNKYTLAENFGARIAFSGVIPARGIANADLCTVVGNLVDNAIEGIKRCEGDRTIAVRAAVRDGMLTFSVKNPVAQKIIIKNNKLKTTKSDAVNHGIGLKNVAAVAKKYHGGLLLFCDDEAFTADVTMRLTLEETEEGTP